MAKVMAAWKVADAAGSGDLDLPQIVWALEAAHEKINEAVGVCMARAQKGRRNALQDAGMIAGLAVFLRLAAQEAVKGSGFTLDMGNGEGAAT